MCVWHAPCDVGLAHADEVLVGGGGGLGGLLAAEEVGVGMVVLVVVEARVPEVCARRAQVGDELTDDQRCGEGGHEGGGDVGACHSGSLRAESERGGGGQGGMCLSRGSMAI